MKSASDIPSAPSGPSAARPLEPVRLLAGGGNALERRLLESAGIDRMPAASRQQLERALGAGAAPGSTPAAAAGTSRWLQLSPLVKSAALTGLGALALLGAWAAEERAPAVVAPRALDARAAPTTPSPEPAAPVRLAPPPSPVVSAAPAPAPPAPPPVESSAKRRTAPQRAASRAPAPSAAAVRSGLSEELRLLDGAQAALRSGRTRDAQQALDQHAQRFGAGELALEAELLGIELQLQRGERAAAQAHARQLAQRPEAARYRARLESLLRAGSDAAGGVDPSSGHMKERR